jgi:hypothetical protein
VNTEVSRKRIGGVKLPSDRVIPIPAKYEDANVDRRELAGNRNLGNLAVRELRELNISGPVCHRDKDCVKLTVNYGWSCEVMGADDGRIEEHKPNQQG